MRHHSDNELPPTLPLPLPTKPFFEGQDAIGLLRVSHRGPAFQRRLFFSSDNESAQHADYATVPDGTSTIWYSCMACMLC